LDAKLQNPFHISLLFLIFVAALHHFFMKVTKKQYILGFSGIVVVLAIIRCACPSVTQPRTNHIASNNRSADSVTVKDSAIAAVKDSDAMKACEDTDTAKAVIPHSSDKKVASIFVDSLGNPVKHRIYSVSCFRDAFPDMNDVQLVAAQRYGVEPVSNREEAERRKKELVFVGSNPYFYIDRLHSSIPYLVPRASIMLQQIGRNFYDSLTIKGIPLHKIIITSVMRSKEDVTHLRGHNGNATQNSCHLYGTTFDVCYNRYKTIEDPDGPARRKVRNDTLKWVLSEVLNDMRKGGHCYIKYEVNQGCFHITVK
jgi:hypothetical protein